MSYYQDEVLKELVVGDVYTERQIAIFIYENPRSLVLSKGVGHFKTSGHNKVEVLEKKDVYPHTTKDGVYQIPNAKMTIYITE